MKRLTKESYLLTEIPEILGVKYLTCHLYIKNKKLKGYKINNRWHIKRDDLISFMNCKSNMDNEVA